MVNNGNTRIVSCFEILPNRLVSKAEKSLTDHTEFIAAKEKVEEWLNRAHGTVQDCIGEGDLGWIKDKLQTVNLVSSRITEGIVGLFTNEKRSNRIIYLNFRSIFNERYARSVHESVEQHISRGKRRVSK